MDVLEADGVEKGGMRGDVDVEAGLGHSFLSLECGMDMSGGGVLAGWLVWVVLVVLVVDWVELVLSRWNHPSVGRLADLTSERGQDESN